MDFGGFKRLGQSHGWKNAWQSFGQHRLATTWATDEHHVMGAGGCDLQGSFYTLLTFYILKISGILIFKHQVFQMNPFWLNHQFSIQKIHHLAQVLSTDHIETIYHGCFFGVLLGNDQTFIAFLLGLYRHGQHPANRVQGPVER